MLEVPSEEGAGLRSKEFSLLAPDTGRLAQMKTHEPGRRAGKSQADALCLQMV